MNTSTRKQTKPDALMTKKNIYDLDEAFFCASSGDEAVELMIAQHGEYDSIEDYIDDYPDVAAPERLDDDKILKVTFDYEYDVPSGLHQKVINPGSSCLPV